MGQEFEKDGKHQIASKLRINNKLHQTFISRIVPNNTIQDIFDIAAVINCHAMNRFVINAMSLTVRLRMKEPAPQTRPLIPLTNIVVLCSGPRACFIATNPTLELRVGSKKLVLNNSDGYVYSLLV